MKEYKLNVDPRILELLGPNLYTNIYYVLAELIANAYDADAKNVYIMANKDDIRVEDDGHGSAIVMRQPQYRLHKTLAAVKRNLLKIFPLVSSEFCRHIIRDREHEIIDDFDRSIMDQLCTLIALGEEFAGLCELVPETFPNRRRELVVSRDSFRLPLTMRDNVGVEHEYPLEFKGWIGTYKTTRGRKAEMTDFPDNFVSLFANKKLGEFNILPVIGQNKLNEVYVVGQLHVDLFELSELPDMALSNRQGYKSDDPRYEEVREYVRKDLLAEILRKRELYADLVNAEKKKTKAAAQKSNEAKLREAMDDFRKKASRTAAERLERLAPGVSRDAVEEAVSSSINENSPDLGLKSIVDSQKRKVLISQTYSDKALSDIPFQMLMYNNVPADDILYTNCDDEVCRVPEGTGVYEYLRDFFVESYSTQKIFVLFVTSENTKMSWGAITEVGAAWITQIDHKIFNVRPFRPEHPLDDEMQWQSTNREAPPGDELWMDNLNADIFCQKIEAVCDAVGYKKSTRKENMNHLATLVSVRSA